MQKSATPHMYDNFKTSKMGKLDTLLKTPESKLKENSLATARAQKIKIKTLLQARVQK